MSFLKQLYTHIEDGIFNAAISFWLFPSITLKKLQPYAESGTYGAGIAFVALPQLEPIMEALRHDRCDLTSHPWAASLVGAFTGVAMGNGEADDYHPLNSVDTALPCLLGIMAGTAAPATVSALSGAFAAAWLGLYWRRHYNTTESFFEGNPQP